MNRVKDYVEHMVPSMDRKPFRYHEIYGCLKETMGYSWRKANNRPPRFLRQGIQGDKAIFIEFLKLLEKMEFTVCYVDECCIHASALPLYTWSKKGQDPEKMIRATTNRYNAIAALVQGRCMFHVKKGPSNQDTFIEFVENLYTELKLLLSSSQLKYRTVIVLDNARIHLTKRVRESVKKLGMVFVSCPPYCPEVNKIEHLFGTLKNKLAQRNLIYKDFLSVVLDVISTL